VIEEKRKIVELSSQQLMYLRNTNFLPTSLLRIVAAAKPIREQRFQLHVPNDIAEEFRSVFTDRLAKVGFKADYEPTSEGKVLEELIDRFFG